MGLIVKDNLAGLVIFSLPLCLRNKCLTCRVIGGNGAIGQPVGCACFAYGQGADFGGRINLYHLRVGRIYTERPVQLIAVDRRRRSVVGVLNKLQLTLGVR